MKDFDEEEEKLKKKMAEMEEEKEKLQKKIDAMNKQKEKLEKIMEDDDGVIEEEEDEEKKELEERLAKTEFNNEEEDEKVIKGKEEKALSDKNNKIIFAATCLLIAIMIGAIILVFGKNHGDSKQSDSEKGSGSEQSETQKEERSSYGVTNGSILFTKYIYADRVITDLLGEGVADIDDSFDLAISSDTIYEYNGAYARNTSQKVIIKKLVDKYWKSVLEKDFNGTNFDYVGTVLDTSYYLLGVYDNSGSNGKLYLLDGDTYREVTLPGKGIYVKTNGVSASRFVYDNRYIMTYDKRYNTSAVSSDNDLIGLYDINSKQEIITPVYDEMTYLDEGRFLVKRDGKAGIIDASGKTLLDFKYKKLEKRGDYFIAIKGNDLVVLNSKYQEISGAFLENVTSFVSKSFKGNLLVGKEVGSKTMYYYLDSSNHFTALVDGSVKVSGDYLVVQEFNSTVAAFYNKSMKKVKEYDLKVSINNWNLYFFFDNYFIMTQDNGSIRFYDHSEGKQINVLQRFYRYYNKVYYVEFAFTNGNKGTVTIKKDDKILGTLENATFDNYVSTNNNGVSFGNNMVFYYAIGSNGNDVLVIKEK